MYYFMQIVNVFVWRWAVPCSSQNKIYVMLCYVICNCSNMERTSISTCHVVSIWVHSWEWTNDHKARERLAQAHSVAHCNVWEFIKFLQGQQSNTDMSKQALLRGESVRKKELQICIYCKACSYNLRPELITDIHRWFTWKDRHIIYHTISLVKRIGVR